MTRLLATTALLGALLAVPALAQTATTKMPPHHVHHRAAMETSGSSAPGHRHHAVSGDHSAEMLNRGVLQDLHKGG